MPEEVESTASQMDIEKAFTNTNAVRQRYLCPVKS